MNLKCPICEQDVQSISHLPFGEEITCLNCKTELVFDYDEGEEGPSFWLVTKSRYESSDYMRLHKDSK